MKGSDVVVAIAQVAAGGTIVQGVMALLRRRSELRQLDSQTDSVAIETANHVMGMLRKELDDAKAELAQLKRDHEAERQDLQRQIQKLGTRVSGLSAELAVERAEISRLRSAQGG